MKKKSSKPNLAAITHYPTPMVKQPKMDHEEKIAFIADRFRDIMEALGMDLSDDSLARTPQRVAKMYVNEIFSGLDVDNFPSITTVDDHYQHEGRPHVLLMRTNFTSFCEHHFVPMIGKAWVAYLPNKKLIGLSKIPRLVRYFARRPQLQERLTAQIADSLALLLDTEDVAVSLSAEHYCIAARGIETEESHVITHVLRGKFEKDPNIRREFFDLIQR
jgi:GTP cyclohydrolase I